MFADAVYYLEDSHGVTSMWKTLYGTILSASILGFSSGMYFQFLPHGGDVIFIVIPIFLFDFKNRTHIASLYWTAPMNMSLS